MQHVTRIQPEELPDGSFFTPHRILPATGSNLAKDDSVVRPAEYISSFPVEGGDQQERAEFVRHKLETLRIVSQSQPVLLVISLTGIKICSEEGESVLMAHALRRISYATCDPDSCSFSFLAREPKGQASIQYCHAFGTETPDQAEELNRIVGDAFKFAFAQQRQSQQQPTFNDVIERQLQASRCSKQRDEEHAQDELNKNLKQISTGCVMDIAAHRKEQRQKSHTGDEGPSASSSSATDSSRLGNQPGCHPRHSSAVSLTPAPLTTTTGTTATSAASNVVANRDVHGHHSSSVVLLLKPGASLHPSLETPLDMSMDLKGLGSPVVAIKERLDAEAAANQMMTSSQTTSVHHSCSTLEPSSTAPSIILKSTMESDATPPRFYFNTKPTSQQMEAPQPPMELPPDPVLSEEEAPPVPPVRYNSLRKYDAPERRIPAPPDTDPPSPPHPSSYGVWQPRIEEEDSGEDMGTAAWYQAAIPREIALEVLAREEVGRFVVRDSSSHPGCYALSVKVPKFDNPSGITHYLIQRTQRGVKLKGLEKEWPSLLSLVTHLTVLPEMLPCTLKMPRVVVAPSNALTTAPFGQSETSLSCNDQSAFVTCQPHQSHPQNSQQDRPLNPEEYQRLSDFSSIMADLGGVTS